MQTKPQKINLIYDGMNILIPLLNVPPMYNSQLFNINPIRIFFKKIFKDIVFFAEYFKIFGENEKIFEILVKNNVINILTNSYFDIYIVFDFGSDIYRRKLNKDYKEDRNIRRKLSLKENLEEEITFYRKFLYEMFQLLGYKSIILPFVEADVIVAYLTSRLSTDQTSYSIIISNDSDFYELLDKNILIYNHKSKKLIDDSIECRKEELYRLKYIKDKSLTFYPSLTNTVYFKTLRGDKADSIPILLRKNYFDLFINYLIRNKIDKIESIEHLSDILKKLKISINFTDILNNYHLICLKHYISNHLKPNDIIFLEKTLNKQLSPNFDKFNEYLIKLELKDYNYTWIFS